MMAVGLCVVALAGLVAPLGRPGGAVDRVATEEPAQVGDTPAWEREYGAEEIDSGQLKGVGEFQRVHVVSFAIWRRA